MSRRWQMTSLAAQFLASGRRTRTASLWPRIAAARSSAVRDIRPRRCSQGCLATSSRVGMSALSASPLAVLDGAAIGAGLRRLHGLPSGDRLQGVADVVLRALDVAAPRGGPVVDRARVYEGAGLVDHVHVAHPTAIVPQAHTRPGPPSDRHDRIVGTMDASSRAATDAIVFDLDGTLWDTCETCAIGWNLVLDRNAIRFRTITADDVRAVAGKPHEQCIRETFVGVPEPQILTLIAETQLEDNRLVAEQGGVLYPDVEDGIRRLRARSPLFIVRNCQPGYF